MLRIDSHQHFWLFNEVRDSWITNEMSILRRNFLPADVYPKMQDANIQGSIAVQADQSEDENRFLLSLAKDNSFIKGVVGWIDLCAENIEIKLRQYAADKKMKGFRHILQGEKDRAFMLSPAFTNGISQLKPFGFTYDILILPDQLAYLPQFLQKHPEQKFVIDHLAKPGIKTGDIKDWREHMQRVASYPNVCCKVSGMATEADWQHWQPADFTPYLDTIWNAFGAERVMFGSDWPVCLLATGYTRWTKVMEAYTVAFSMSEKESFWGKNAVLFYNLFE